MFDVLFIALELLLIERFLAVRSRAIFALPVVVLVWANFHGGFVFSFFFLGLTGLALLVRWLLQRERGLLISVRDLIVVTILCGIASLITPYGPGLFVYVWRTQFSSQLSGFVLEWQSPDFHMLQMLPFLAVFHVLCALQTRQLAGPAQSSVLANVRRRMPRPAERRRIEGLDRVGPEAGRVGQEAP